jgi:hypothetical protein
LNFRFTFLFWLAVMHQPQWDTTLHSYIHTLSCSWVLTRVKTQNEAQQFPLHNNFNPWWWLYRPKHIVRLKNFLKSK